MLLTGVASRSNQESVRSIMRAKPAVVNGAPPFRREPRGTILQSHATRPPAEKRHLASTDLRR